MSKVGTGPAWLLCSAEVHERRLRFFQKHCAKNRNPCKQNASREFAIVLENFLELDSPKPYIYIPESFAITRVYESFWRAFCSQGLRSCIIGRSMLKPVAVQLLVHGQQAVGSSAVLQRCAFHLRCIWPGLKLQHVCGKTVASVRKEP